MTRVVWRPLALEDREAILEHIAQDNPVAACEIDDEIEAKAEQARLHPTLYRAGRVRGTREAVVRPDYVLVYRVEGEDDDRVIVVLRVLHAAQPWPPGPSR